MSGPARNGLFLYAKDLERLAGFYQSLLAMRRVHATAELVVLQIPASDMQLVIHAIPAPIAVTISITTPPVRREDTALKFFLTVPSLPEARRLAASLGGEVYTEQWQGPGFVVSNACDPEGNIFQLRESLAAARPQKPIKPPIGPATRLCMSLAARPGSFGSRFQNRLYEHLGLDYVYKAFTTTDLAAAIGGIRALGIRGCAISMPFKETVIPLLDRLEGSAAAIDSVNTIVNDEGRLSGYNTDYSAIIDVLAQAGVTPQMSFLLRGSGGMAKAVAAALRDRGHRSGTVVARNETSGRALAEAYGFSWAANTDGLAAPLLINATPLGMVGPDADRLAFPEALIARSEIVFDVVALPAETPLMQAAQRLGRRRISGADIIVLQALEQFVLYTGVRPDADTVAEAAAFARSP